MTILQKKRRGAVGLAAALFAAAIAPAVTQAAPGDTQKGATAATAAAVGAWINSARKPSSEGRRNTAFALTGASGYLWKRAEDERRAESRKRAAREAYYRHRSAYYKRVAARNARYRVLYHRKARTARR